MDRLLEPDFLGKRIRGGNMVRGGICRDLLRSANANAPAP